LRYLTFWSASPDGPLKDRGNDNKGESAQVRHISVIDCRTCKTQVQVRRTSPAPTASRQDQVVPFVGPPRPDLHRVPVYDEGLLRFEGNGGAVRVQAVSVEIAKAFEHVGSGKAVRNAVDAGRRDGPRLGRLLASDLGGHEDKHPGFGGAARLADRPVDFGKCVGRGRPKNDRGIRQGIAGRV
jgi:hypothetical protein